MSFGSVDFILFFTAAVCLYFWVPQRLKNAWLLLCSLAFYRSFTARFLPLLLGVIVACYAAGHLLARLRRAWARRVVLFAGVGGLLGMLVLFKYYELIRDTLYRGQGILLPASGVSGIPMGISFFTLVAMGYLVDLYRNKYAPEKNIIHFAVLLCFFPLISSGPIERGSGLLPQLKAPASFDYDRMRRGLTRMLWGYFKKFVVADHLAVMVTSVYGERGSDAVYGYTGPFLCLATLLFAYQLYCDFSGYSDIAIGAAEVLGIRVMENFARPFASGSYSDLWDRWHISLSSWFRDYLYFPLGGSRKGRARAYLNVMLVFLVSGLWHGAGWTFAVWGAANGLFVVLSKLYTAAGRPLERHNPLYRIRGMQAVVQGFLCFGIFAFCFVLFRANSFADAAYIYIHALTGWGEALLHPGATVAVLKTMSIGRVTGLLMLVSIPLIEFVQYREARTGKPMAVLVLEKPGWQRVAFWYFLLLLLAVVGLLGNSSFIYFGF